MEKQGTIYGVPLDLWSRMKPEAKEVMADTYRMAHPENAIPEGAREALTLGGVTTTKLEGALPLRSSARREAP